MQQRQGKVLQLVENLSLAETEQGIRRVRANDAALTQVPIMGSLAWSFTQFYPA